MALGQVRRNFLGHLMQMQILSPETFESTILERRPETTIIKPEDYWTNDCLNDFRQIALGT